MEVVEYQPEKDHQRYFLKDGSEVKGASTIAKVDDDPGALIGWAWRLGRDGIDWKKFRDAAGEAGSVGHFMIHCHFKRKVPDFKKVSQVAIDAGKVVFDKFMDWWTDNELKCVATEIELVSEKYKYGGTTDLVATDPKDRLWVIDVKTGKGIYWGYKCQAVACGNLWTENKGGEIYQHVVVKLPREQRRVETCVIHNPEEVMECFLDQLKYTNDKYKAGGYS